jgi:hypothetical protein
MVTARRGAPARPARSSAKTRFVRWRGLGGSDAKHAGARGDPLNLHQAQKTGDGSIPCGLIVDHDAPLAGRAAAGEHAIFAKQKVARPVAGQVLLSVSPGQAPVGDDPIELCHQGGLRQDRQLIQPDVTAACIADGPAVIRGVRDRVPHHLAEAPALELEQSRAWPTLAIEHLGSQRLGPLAGVLILAIDLHAAHYVSPPSASQRAQAGPRRSSAIAS